MGSSKKHKDKDRDREHKKKRKHRSRSRSRERKHKREKRDREDRKRKPEDLSLFDKELEEYAFSQYIEEGEIPSSSHEVKPDLKKEEPPGPSEASGHSGGGGDLQLSIEETNRLRAKLGLKPLDTGGSKGGDGEDKKKQEDVHVPAVNLAKVKKTKELREKMAAIKEKRKINQKLGKVKTLGESDSDEDSALAWVKKSRKIQIEKQQAEKRAKLLDDMDEEFGIGDLVQEEFQPKKPEYSSKHLKGLTVQHGLESFAEGKSVILTLEDRAILDEEGADTLVNVNMVDDERTAKNLENKKKKPDYKPYDEPEFDEYGMLKPTELLSKYDEEIEGSKKESFALGAGGHYNAEHEKRMQEIRIALRQKGETLTLPAPNLAREYYTPDEMDTKFKKVKRKVRKIRKKPQAVKADDLIPLNVGPGATDLGSRRRHTDIKTEANGEGAEGVQIPGLGDWGESGSAPVKEEVDPEAAAIPGLDLVDMEVDQPEPMDETEILGPEEDLSGVVIDDDAANELQAALTKARKVKQKKERKFAPERIAAMMPVKQEEESDEEEQQQGNTMETLPVKGGKIMLSSTSEFCRSLGEIPTYGLAGNREEDEDELMDFERELQEQRRRQEEEEREQAASGWEQVDIDTRPVEIGQEEHAALEEEPSLTAGLAGALALANKKGYLADDLQAKKAAAAANRNTDMDAQNYSIEDKSYNDLDEKYNKKASRYGGGITTDFKEKEGYKPDVKIEYVDEKGRAMSAKEAFRALSHRFHGKGSGKKKTEKRAKKIEEENLMKMMSSTDTPLGTVELLREKQKSEQTPYLVLSGGGKTLSSGTIAKPT